MAFQLKEKKYTWIDMVRIPFTCDALGTSGLVAQKALTAASAIIQVPVVAKFIDTAVASAQGKASMSDAVVWLVLLMVCAGWRRISVSVGRLFTDHMIIRAYDQLSREFTAKRTRLHYSHIENPETWNLINRVTTNIQTSANYMLHSCVNIFVVYSVRIFGMLIIVFTQVWWAGLLTIGVCVPLVLLSFKTGSVNYNAHKKASHFDRRHQYLAEVLTGREAADERALFGYSGHVSDMWYEQYETARKIRLSANIKRTATNRGGNMMAVLLSSFISVALVIPTAKGQISTGMFIALSTGMYDLVHLMGWSVANAVTTFSRYYEYVKDIGLFAKLEEVAGAEDVPSSEVMEFAGIELRNVSFKYPGTDVYILKNASLTIENGVHYAFVGVNGAGKTTITKLVTGLYDNYEGEIFLNGRELKEYTQPQLKAMFSGVYQDFAKYYIPAKDNVLLGNVNRMDKDETRERMVDVLETLDLYDELSKLPNGLDTPLGKMLAGGVDLSGGQWQRLAMARTLINPAPVLILDEPTAALDPISESRLYERFEEISRGKTTIFISHRLGSTRLSDKIFVLSDGEVSEQGSHSELMAMNGIYAEMYESQRSWYAGA